MSAEVALRSIYSKDEVRARIDELVERLYRAYADCPVLFVVIAEGARRFAEALVQGLGRRGVEPELVYLRARRTRGTELASVQVEATDPTAFEDRDVLVIDDIADEGRTLEAVLQIVREGEPRSLRTAVLVSKTGRRRGQLQLDYTGFEVKSGWVVGFGMDLDGRHRDLDHLAIAEQAPSAT
jgi:hypoxanthine phosphoribosyltransferase